MTDRDTYRQHAAELVKLAQSASAPADKGRLLSLAEAWLDLVDGSKALASRYRRRLVRVMPLKNPDESRPNPD